MKKYYELISKLPIYASFNADLARKIKISPAVMYIIINKSEVSKDNLKKLISLVRKKRSELEKTKTDIENIISKLKSDI